MALCSASNCVSVAGSASSFYIPLVIVEINFCHGMGAFLCLFWMLGWRGWVPANWGLLHLVSLVSEVLKRDRLLPMFLDAA